MSNFQKARNWHLYKLRQQELEEEQERIKNGYARVSKDGEVYLDFSDRRTQKAMQALIKRFATLTD
jgi:molecular chaperone GrpE (heat shock protein)